MGKKKKKTYIGLYVLVLKVEGVLPYVDTNDRSQSKQGILIGSGGNFEAFGGRVIALK